MKSLAVFILVLYLTVSLNAQSETSNTSENIVAKATPEVTKSEKKMIQSRQIPQK